MHRRAAIADALLLLVALVALVALVVTIPAASVGASATDPGPGRPPVTENEFLPEERNLGDCIGALERPGCGSEARGGWRQTLVFVAVGTGLAVVIGRIVWAARRKRQHT